MEITTTQNVAINFEKANVGDRILATLIDGLIVFGYYFGVFFFLALLGITGNNVMFSAVGIILFLPVFFYNLLFEVFMGGQSPGKRMRKIKVVRLDGERPTFGSYLIRWLFRPIEILSCSGSIALITILINGKSQRIGDLAAGTCVISLKKEMSLNETVWVELEEGYIPVFPQVKRLNDSDFRIIKHKFDEAVKEEDFKMINLLANKIKKVLAIETAMYNQPFVETIVKDYNYFMGK
ncbi:RDD family protein [Xanthovirga aplysinae]|uniref:RDD family protein n=1 Tax=Xanthovirga aplysinae TaxID=2529853 RepID=UPI0012BD615D|nr:RDD family protein [Xanthovirga aplysinae]MTI32848.1 RDD family protein [Xanthovirga aplysinae]